jgi:hypothetical protein
VVAFDGASTVNYSLGSSASLLELVDTFNVKGRVLRFGFSSQCW